jgi:hypothetical protein
MSSYSIVINELIRSQMAHGKDTLRRSNRIQADGRHQIFMHNWPGIPCRRKATRPPIKTLASPPRCQGNYVNNPLNKLHICQFRN